MTDHHNDVATIPVIDVGTDTSCRIITGGPEWKALLEWTKAHGLDPDAIVARFGVVRDAEACCIRYVEFVLDEEGHKLLTERRDGFQQRHAIEQGEAPPLPFPEIIASRLLPIEAPPLPEERA